MDIALVLLAVLFFAWQTCKSGAPKHRHHH